MNVKKKKSKRRSAASSKQPRNVITLFLDRNLGNHIIADALRKAGAVVEIHDDHLVTDAPDEDWISLASRKKWLAITKDKNVRYRAAEIDAIKVHRAKVLVVRAKNATGQDIADFLVSAIAKIQRYSRKNRAPFIAGIDRSGHITKYKV